MLKCSDETLYTGITTDTERRLKEHNGKEAAKYTRARQPVVLLFSKKAKTRSAALIEEARIKKLSRQEKLALAKLSRQKGIL